MPPRLRLLRLTDTGLRGPELLSRTPGAKQRSGTRDHGLLGPAAHGSGLVEVPVHRRPRHAGQVGDLLDGLLTASQSCWASSAWSSESLAGVRRAGRGLAWRRARRCVRHDQLCWSSASTAAGPANIACSFLVDVWMPCSVMCGPTAVLAQRRRSAPGAVRCATEQGSRRRRLALMVWPVALGVTGALGVSWSVRRHPSPSWARLSSRERGITRALSGGRPVGSCLVTPRSV